MEEGNPPGRRKRGGPKGKWADGIRELLGVKGINRRRLERQRQREEIDNCQVGAR